MLGGGGETDVSAILDICVRRREETLEGFIALAGASIGFVEDQKRLTALANRAERVVWEPVTFFFFDLLGLPGRFSRWRMGPRQGRWSYST